MKIILQRKNEWFNRLRAYKVLLDGQPVGKISNGQVEEYNIPPAAREIECQVDWCYSNKYPLSASNDEVVYLRVTNGMKAIWLIYIVLFLYLLSVFVFPGLLASMGENGRLISRSIVFLPLLYIGYYLTIGRRQYLRMDKDATNVFGS